MKFLDLFAGVGGVRLGMEQAGHSCIGWVEWDKFARKSYVAIHKPDGEFTEKDINNVTSQELPKADCWCFGFPCQDISVAGKQGGFTNGKRSSLFFKVTGLIKQLKEEDKPSYLFIENVKNLLSINKGWDFAKLLIEMDEIGYDVEWDVIDSAEVVPQHRERIFIVGHLRGRGTRKVFPIIRKGGKTNKAIKEVARIYPNRHSSDSNSVIDPSGISHTVTAHSYKDSPKIVVNQLGNISNSKSFGGNPQVGRVYGTDGIAPTLSTMQGGGQEPKIAIPVSSPDIIFKNQNGRRFKENGDPEFSLTVRDRHGILTNRNNPKVAVREATKSGYDVAQLGDSINFAQPNSKTRRGRVGHGVANTLTTVMEQATLTGDLKIRKLTPLECWRLQGFPDWAFTRAREAGLSDSQLYKQAGNSVTVPVIKAIADRMGYNDNRQGTGEIVKLEEEK
jgi:DNA (cytosine-5)-methyltransferase 1